MGHSQAVKAKNHERILDEAASQVRENGLGALSVGKLMEKVNLTHGGFYGHFESRSAMIAAALDRALQQGSAQARAARDASKPRSFMTIVKGYLSRTHRDYRSDGCAMAALISDVARADEASRAVMEPHLERFIRNVADALNDEDDQRAIVAVSAMIGALAISRVITDPKRSDAVLRAAKDGLLALSADASS